MTQSPPISQFNPRPAPPAQRPRPHATLRTIAALVLREMSTTYGRSALGYLWALLEPTAGIMLMTVVFSFTFNAPPLGNNFPLFYASGMLPFLAYLDVSNKVAVSLRFSKALMFYPGVTYVDALMARFVINGITQMMIAVTVMGLIYIFFPFDVMLDMPPLLIGYVMSLSLALGIGTLNCYLLSTYPLWERAWAVLNRPLFIVSCIFYVFNSLPEVVRGWLWWNPLIHVIGEIRSGIYPSYDASYVSVLYVMVVSGVTFSTGLLLLRRYHRDIVNF